jgi:transposase
MGAERLPMRRIRDVVRLKYEGGLSHRSIAKACGLGVGTVSEYVARAKRAGLGWPLPAALDEAALEARLFPVPEAGRERPMPDPASLHQELKGVGVTLQLLWEEYREIHGAAGYGYSQFCELYRRWAGKLRPSMRQLHRAGEKVFVDFSGKRPHIVDRRSGELIPVELFVGALGASCFTYAEATATQKLHDWVDAHRRMLEYFGGSPAIWVPDQLKSAITRSCRYEPGVNRTYQELASHYGAVVIPARPAKPRDKAKVETMVLVAQRWILARLRKRTFFDLAELNAAIRELLEQLNDRLMQKLGVSRREQWERLDRPALKPLPAGRYDVAQWTACKVNIDYHVEVDHHHYSVPYQLRGQDLEARSTSTIVEIYHHDHRVESYPRRYDRGHTTRPEWTPSRLIHWAEKNGPACARVVAGILESRPHPEQGYRSCLGLMRLGKRYGPGRLEAACERAEHLRSYSYRTVKNILASSQDRLPFEDETPDAPTTRTHDNIRGAEYYRGAKEYEC